MTHFFDATLLPRIISGLEGISISGGESQNVLKVERWDAFDRDSRYLVHAEIRTLSQRRVHSEGEWICSRRVAIDCTLAQDQTLAQTTDELLSRFEADVATVLGDIDCDYGDANLSDIEAEWFQRDNPDVQDVGVSIVASYSWTEDRDTGEHTGPG